MEAHNKKQVPSQTRNHKLAMEFPRFSELPAEIRCMVWEAALPEDVSEVYILKPYLNRPNVALPKVDICFPTGTRVCRESRDISMRRLQTRPSPEAGIKIPCRDFRPELDVLYVGAFNFYPFFSRPEFFYGGLVHRLQHMAVDIVLTSTHDRIPNVFQHLNRLRTLTVVFGQPHGNHRAGEALHLSYPIRRCRLRDFTNEELGSARVGNPDPRVVSYRPVGEYLAGLRQDLEDRTREFLPSWGDIDISVWDHDKQKLNLDIKVQTLMEYRIGPKGPEWLEKGKENFRAII
ncbi:hypothetical protein BX600DRAFT_431197 [Xylariales sp. PMI_506]|nr:hypothetical protein BX600DRAFT_431197 [Xylariales sp. PMI_506]